MDEFTGDKVEKMNVAMHTFVEKIIEEYKPTYTEVKVMLYFAQILLEKSEQMELFVIRDGVKDDNKDDDKGPGNIPKFNPEDFK